MSYSNVHETVTLYPSSAWYHYVSCNHDVVSTSWRWRKYVEYSNPGMASAHPDSRGPPGRVRRWSIPEASLGLLGAGAGFAGSIVAGGIYANSTGQPPVTRPTGNSPPVQPDDSARNNAVEYSERRDNGRTLLVNRDRMGMALISVPVPPVASRDAPSAPETIIMMRNSQPAYTVRGHLVPNQPGRYQIDSITDANGHTWTPEQPFVANLLSGQLQLGELEAEWARRREGGSQQQQHPANSVPATSVTPNPTPSGVTGGVDVREVAREVPNLPFMSGQRDRLV